MKSANVMLSANFSTVNDSWMLNWREESDNSVVMTHCYNVIMTHAHLSKVGTLGQFLLWWKNYGDIARRKSFCDVSFF